MLRLVERGQLALEQPLRAVPARAAPARAPSTDRLTLLHLLTHTGGFQGDVRDGAYGVRCGAGGDALARFLELLAHLPQHAPPGAMWAYNNAGFSLAGRVIEVVTGQPFEDALRNWCSSPWGYGAGPSSRRCRRSRSGPARRSGTPSGPAGPRSCAGGRCPGCWPRPAGWSARPATCCATPASTWATAPSRVAGGCSRPSRWR